MVRNFLITHFSQVKKKTLILIVIFRVRNEVFHADLCEVQISKYFPVHNKVEVVLLFKMSVLFFYILNFHEILC